MNVWILYLGCIFFIW